MQDQGTFFLFSKKGRGDPPHPASCAPASSVNDVKCSNALVSEFMNEVDDITDITIFDFTVP